MIVESETVTIKTYTLSNISESELRVLRYGLTNLEFDKTLINKNTALLAAALRKAIDSGMN